MNGPDPSNLTLLILLPLIAWRVYARFRRLVGRQRLSRVRPWITLTVFPLLVLLLGAVSRAHPERLGWLAGGLFAGVLLGRYGLSKTRFEAVPGALFYTPNAHLGIALSLLFLVRVAFRIAQVLLIDPSTPRGMSDFASSALTLAVFGLLAGYYIRYAIGLLRWRWGVLRAKRAREARRLQEQADAASAARTPAVASAALQPASGDEQ